MGNNENNNGNNQEEKKGPDILSDWRKHLKETIKPLKAADKGAMKIIAEHYKWMDEAMKQVGEAMGPAKDILEAMSKVKFSIDGLYGEFASRKSEKRGVKIDPPKGADSKVVKAGKGAIKGAGQETAATIIEGAQIHAAKTKKIRIFYDDGGKGGELILSADDDNITIQLANKRDVKLEFKDKGIYFTSKGKNTREWNVDCDESLIEVKEHISIYSREGRGVSIIAAGDNGNVEVECKKKDIKVTADKGNISVKAKEGDVSVEADKGNISMKAPKGKISLEAENIEMKATKNFEVKTTKLTKIKSKDFVLDTTGGQLKAANNMTIKTTSGQLKLNAGLNAELKAKLSTNIKGKIINLN